MKTISKNSARLWHVDFIRGIAMLLGIPFHVGMIFSAGHEWFVTSQEKSVAIMVVTGVLTSFRMPLFFFVAGLLAAMVLERKPSSQWGRRRVERLGVPLLVSTVLISPIIIAAVAYDEHFEIPDVSYAHLLAARFQIIDNQWVGHLWFIQCLLAYSLLTPFLLRARKPISRAVDVVVRGWKIRWSVALVLFGAFMSAYRFGVDGFFYVAESRVPDIGALTEIVKLSAFFSYLPYYFVGLCAYGLSMPRFHRSRIVWVVFPVALLFYAEYWNISGMREKIFTYASLGFASVLGTAVVLSFSSEVVTRKSALITYLVDASFTVYLVHYPIIIWLGFLLSRTELNPIIGYVVCILVAFALAFGIHEIVRRSSWLSYLLNGKPFTPHRSQGVLEK